MSSFPRHPATWFSHLWHEFHQPQEEPGEGFQSPYGEEVTAIATDILDRRADDLFQYVQYWDPHGPYRRSDEEVERFSEYPTPPYPTAEQIEEHRTWDAWRSASEPGVADEGLRHVDADAIEDRAALDELISHYDAEIRYVDRWVNELLDGLREHGTSDETLVVLTADHGEEFGEHGVYREHWSVHDGTQRVPLVVKPPASIEYESGSRDQLVTNVGLAPTIADYAGLELPDAWQGRSLCPLIAGEESDWRDHIVVDHGLYTAQRAVRTDRWKFVRTYNPGHWGGVTSDHQLFDMEDDPWEQTDVSGDHPDVVEELETKLLRWAEDHRSENEDSLRRTTREGPFGIEWGGPYEGV
ncbi:sulfatase-like hydrolase/transferase [Halosimplex rubrum]|uniref:Sulfatase-like hydrolase/transferase n=1 Tax=Halosimplex rubrum TaxID=869889 RepID=A0A7D5T0Z5_9EURY|nr:sulfatase-like hydrolase/transferase [Halosimplex rubrum]